MGQKCPGTARRHHSVVFGTHDGRVLAGVSVGGRRSGGVQGLAPELLRWAQSRPVAEHQPTANSRRISLRVRHSPPSLYSTLTRVLIGFSSVTGRGKLVQRVVQTCLRVLRVQSCSLGGLLERLQQRTTQRRSLGGLSLEAATKPASPEKHGPTSHRSPQGMGIRLRRFAASWCRQVTTTLARWEVCLIRTPKSQPESSASDLDTHDHRDERAAAQDRL
jgi:hypothetical protein